MQLWEAEESQAAAPRLSLCATHGMGLECQLCAWQQDSCRRDAGLAWMDSPSSRPGGGPVSGALCRNGAREPESSSCGGQGAEGTCCAHGSSQGFSQGTKRCVWWVHVRGPKGCWELLSRVISWQCPRSEDVTAPGRVGEGETPWCNPAGPLALGWATWDEQGVEKLTQTMLEGRAS